MNFQDLVKPEVRRGRVEDVEPLVELAARSFYAVHAPLTSPADCRAYVETAFTKDGQTKELADSKNVFFTAWIGTTMVGYAKLNESSPPQPVGSNPIALQRIYLDDAWFGRGVGGLLMNACLEEAVRRGFKTIWLQVHDKNDRAVQFYKKWNFAIVGPCEFKMGRRTNPNLLLVLDLSP